MRIFENISIINSIDSYCSTIGNELSYEKGKTTNLIFPCFNVGFYENEINTDSITKAVDICYFLFEDILKCEIELNTYENIYPNENGLINFDGNTFKYEYNFQKSIIDVESFYFEGNCFRNNSFSYGSYKVFAKSMKIIFMDESKFLAIYTSNDAYKSSSYYHTFLLNQNKNHIEQIIKVV